MNSKLTAKPTKTVSATKPAAKAASAKNAPAKPAGLPAATKSAPAKAEKPVAKAAPVKTEKPATSGKGPGRLGYGDTKYTCLIKENPCREGFCGDQVDCLLSSKTIAEAQKKLADKGHTRKLEVAWAVSKGYIELAK